MDPNSDEGRLTLFSFVRPDQPERLALLRGALAIGQSVLAVVDAAGAEEWLVHVLAEPRPGCATVVFQSIVWQYLDTAQRQRIAEAMAEAGARAASRAPLAWLRMEPEGAVTTLRRDCSSSFTASSPPCCVTAACPTRRIPSAALPRLACHVANPAAKRRRVGPGTGRL